MNELLEKIAQELHRRSELWKHSPNGDPTTNNAIYVALHDVAESIEHALTQPQESSPQ